MESPQQINWSIEILRILIPSLTSVLVALGLGYWLSSRTEKLKAELQTKLYEYQFQHNERKLVLSKIEELHEKITELMKASLWCASKSLEYAGQPFNTSHLEEITQIITEPYNRIDTLIAFYTHDLEDEFEQVGISLLELQNYGVDFVTHKTRDADELQEKHKRLVRNCQKLLHGLKEQSRKYSNLRRLNQISE